MNENSELPKSTVNAAILAGCIIAFLGFGFSATFGVFLRPMSADLGWSREFFSLSVAIQALAWGARNLSQAWLLTDTGPHAFWLSAQYLRLLDFTSEAQL